MEWIQAHLGSWGGGLASVLSMLGEELVLVALLGFVYWCYDKKWGAYVGTNLMAALAWNPMLKNLVLRPRPYMEHSAIRCLKPVEPEADIMDLTAQGYSFPSGHSSNAATVYGSLRAYKKNRVLTVLMIVLPLLVGVSRVMVGVHYPTDVLCGWVLGAVVVLFCAWLQRRCAKRWIAQLILLVLALPGIFYCRSSDYFTALGMMIGFFAACAFEERYVHFQNTRSILWSILRVAVGLGLFLGLNSVLKLPFSKEFLDSATMGAFLVRTLRYAVVVFLLMAIYPMAFRLEPKKK